MENPIKIDDLRVPPFQETPISIYIYIYRYIYICIYTYVLHDYIFAVTAGLRSLRLVHATRGVVQQHADAGGGGPWGKNPMGKAWETWHFAGKPWFIIDESYFLMIFSDEIWNIRVLSIGFTEVWVSFGEATYPGSITWLDPLCRNPCFHRWIPRWCQSSSRSTGLLEVSQCRVSQGGHLGKAQSIDPLGNLKTDL